MKQKLVIIGNGMAPGRMLEYLFEMDKDAYEITIFNAEPRVNYNRLMLSPVLSGEKSYEDIITHDDQWYFDNAVTLHKGAFVSEIDTIAKTVKSVNGIKAAYDKLVIATGSKPFIIPIPGHDLAGVLVYRDLEDVEKMMDAAKSGGRAVVIGGGLLGLEAAAGLREQGMDVTVLHLIDTLMERQLDPAAGYLLEKAINDRGIDVITKASTKEIISEDGQVRAVRLDDGTLIEASIVVMAVGIRPSIELAQMIGLECNRGIIVGDDMQTSLPDIYALGECVEHRGECYGLVAPLYEMGKILAENLLSKKTCYEGSQTATKLKVNGIDLFSAGDFADGPDREEIVLRDGSSGIYKRLVLKDNHIVGAVLYGETNDGPWFFDLIRKATNISEMRDTLIFGQAYQGGSPLDPTEAVAALPDDAEICGCNGVCKSTIVTTIQDKSLTSLDAVRAHTKASASCGTCTSLVENLLILTAGNSYAPNTVTPVCGCTEHGHEDVRRAIKTLSLKSIPEVMQVMEWQTSCGCAKCRPALNYYLICEWPSEYEDDSQSRYINERVHANIQKDGTYSVVPRMWGGLTTADELRAIADAADKYNIKTVKVTGGQRIDLLGIQKEDLPNMWADLSKAGFVSGHAYAKGLRTVKTCVGSDWCRFGTQDSTGLGVKLEKFLWGSWAPAKVKLAVSGCPRNCSESTCKDVGVICVDSGYEIHFAGAAGLEIMSTEFLGLVKTEEETMEYIAALIQMYREQGHYLERVYKWAHRVGHDTIRKVIMENMEEREALYLRFIKSQELSQSDPWAERAKGKDAHEFTPLHNFPQEAAQ